MKEQSGVYYTRRLAVGKGERMKKSKVKECIDAFRQTGTRTDVQGWYTGTDKEPEQVAENRCQREDARAEELRPVQDADDL